MNRRLSNVCLIAAIVLASCAHDASAPALPGFADVSRGAEQSVRAAAVSGPHRLVYRFTKSSSGVTPSGPLLALGGKLYGTTSGGGPQTTQQQYNGTIYVFDPSTRKQRVVYAFKGGSDGSSPAGALVALNGVLYGATVAGGRTGCQFSCGTVYSIDPASGKERVLHRFAGREGEYLQGGLSVANGKLYGAAAYGGITNTGACTYGCGTIFSIDPVSAHLTILHRFSGAPDGMSPWSPPIVLNGTLYGTTRSGGDRTFCSDYGNQCGAVFSIDLSSGVERVVYTFGGGIDGAIPIGGLVYARGKLYGTTSDGGLGSCAHYSRACGTVFSLVPETGEERVVYRFAGSPDGSDPQADMIVRNGTLYGTTYGGGSPNFGVGTVFAVNMTTRAERTLYAFPQPGGGTAAPRGENPAGGLIERGGVFYGTTAGGGAYKCGFEDESGCGTIFSITP